MKLLYGLAAIAAVVVVAATAQAVPISSLTVTGGNFFMAGAGGTLHPAAFANMSVDGSYDGSVPTAPGTEADYVTTSIATLQFGFFGPVAVFTEPSDSAGNGPFPGVTGDFTGNTLTLDLRSWTAYWTGTDFNQGANNVVAIIDGANYTATWTSTVVGGPFNGQVGHWTLTGSTPCCIPEPRSLSLVGSSLLGLAGVARRRRGSVTRQEPAACSAEARVAPSLAAL
jgi:hypothetical protein